MKYFNTIISVLITFIATGDAFAAEANVNQKLPIEWERFQLEEKLQTKVQNSIEGVLAKEDFVVNLVVNLKKDEEKKPPKARKNAIFLDKLGMWTVTEKRQKSDLFSNIENIAVSIILNEGLLKKKKESVDMATKQALSGWDEKIFKLEYKEAQLDKDTHINWGLTLAGLLCVLVLCLTYFAVSYLQPRWNSKFGGATATVSGGGGASRDVSPVAMNTSGEAGLTAVSGGGVAMAGGGAGGAISAPMSGGSGLPHAESFNSGELVGFKHFKELISSEPKVVVQMLKEWLHMGGKQAETCLSTLAKSDFVHELLPLAENLSLEEKRKWQHHNKVEIQPQMIDQTNLFLSKVIFERVLVPPMVDDVSLQNLITDLETEDCVQIAKESPDQIALLVNLMPTDKVVTVLNSIDPDALRAVTQKGLSLSADEIRKKSKELKQNLMAYNKAKPQVERSPFHESLIDVFTQMDVAKEQIIFDNLVALKDEDSYRELAKEYFPSDLVWQLPAENLRAVITHIPAKQRSELAISMNEDDRKKMLDVIGEGKIREVIDLEMEEIQTSEAELNKVMMKKEQLWQEFVYLVRNTIKVDAEFRFEAQNVLEESIEHRFNGEAKSGPKVA